jgi:predicted aminopeptidase
MRKFKKFRIVFSDLILIFLLAFSLIKTPLTVYGLSQAKGQIKIIIKAQPTDDLISAGKLSAEEKEKLQLIAAVKKFSVDSLNYLPSKNYTNIYDQQGKPLLWIVTACKPYELQAYEWKFPWLGEVSYKGYFDSTKALREYGLLKLKGYDADISRVTAWSTLGWFRDPVFSEMLKKSKGDLAELIFHELFHGTIYARNSVDLNENLANFISWKATMQFLKNDTAALNEYNRDYTAFKDFDSFVLNCTDQLDALYKSELFSKSSLNEKQKSKMQLILKFMNEMEARKFFSKKKTKRVQDRFLYSGNAYFMHFKRYDSMRDSLENIFKNKYHSNLGKMILGLRSEIESL